MTTLVDIFSSLETLNVNSKRDANSNLVYSLTYAQLVEFAELVVSKQHNQDTERYNYIRQGNVYIETPNIESPKMYVSVTDHVLQLDATGYYDVNDEVALERFDSAIDSLLAERLMRKESQK